MHIPVLSKEVIQYLDPRPNENFIDATFGEGGHTRAILEKNIPEGRVLGIEIDNELYQKGLIEIRNQKSEIRNRLLLTNDSFTNLKQIVARYHFSPVHGILFDLGMSSWHIEESKRGFSFLRDEPLFMRYDMKDAGGMSAADIVNTAKEDELSHIFKEYGEERFAKRIARGIVEARRKKAIRSSQELAEIVIRNYPERFFRGNPQRRVPRLHPATRVFQALRIAVNEELQNIEIALPQARDILGPGGRLAVISFHSLEDRIVKHFMKGEAKQGIFSLLTRKPIRPSAEEIFQNPRSRSAKLRAVVKI